jgi:hypothetical protein
MSWPGLATHYRRAICVKRGTCLCNAHTAEVLARTVQSTQCRLLVQLDHLRLADHSHERSDPLRQLRSDVACWSTAATRAIRIRRA